MGESAKSLAPCFATFLVHRNSSTVSRILDQLLFGLVDHLYELADAELASSPFRRFAVWPFRSWCSSVPCNVWKTQANHLPDLILDFIRVTRAIDQDNAI